MVKYGIELYGKVDLFFYFMMRYRYGMVYDGILWYGMG